MTWTSEGHHGCFAELCIQLVFNLLLCALLQPRAPSRYASLIKKKKHRIKCYSWPCWGTCWGLAVARLASMQELSGVVQKAIMIRRLAGNS